MRWGKRRRRARVARRPFPEPWRDILRRNVPAYRELPPEDRLELERHVQVFLSEKRFEGAGGLSITDEIRVTIAAQACLLLLHRETDYYRRLSSIIVYPQAYLARRRSRHASWVWSEHTETRLGESSTWGAVVLAWDAVRAAADDAADCHNVALHEFAHQLDAEDGHMEGSPVLPRAMYTTWARVLGEEFQRLRRDSSAGRETLLRGYGAKSPAEFFAVASECFFARGKAMQARHPALYAELEQYYRQDPAAWGSSDTACEGCRGEGAPSEERTNR